METITNCLEESNEVPCRQGAVAIYEYDTYLVGRLILGRVIIENCLGSVQLVYNSL